MKRIHAVAKGGAMSKADIMDYLCAIGILETKRNSYYAILTELNKYNSVINSEMLFGLNVERLNFALIKKIFIPLLVIDIAFFLVNIKLIQFSDLFIAQIIVNALLLFCIRSLNFGMMNTKCLMNKPDPIHIRFFAIHYWPTLIHH